MWWIRTLLVISPLINTLGVGCTGKSSDGNITQIQSTETVELSISHRSEWRLLWLEGSTSLPDGAFVNYRVTHSMARIAPAEDWPAPNLIDSGRATVDSSQYWTRINTLNWPAGHVEVVVQFPLPPQPPEIMRRFGEFGEYLSGTNVTDLDGMKVVKVTYEFEHNRR